MRVTDWTLMRMMHAGRECQRLKAKLAEVEREMTRARGVDQAEYLRLGALHARLMRTLGRLTREARP